MNTRSRIDMLKEMLKEEPGDSFLIYAIALEHVKNGESKKALKMLEHLLAEDPQYLAAYYQLALIYADEAKFDLLLKIIEKGREVAHAQGNLKTMNELEGLLEQYNDGE